MAVGSSRAPALSHRSRARARLRGDRVREPAGQLARTDLRAGGGIRPRDRSLPPTALRLGRRLSGRATLRPHRGSLRRATARSSCRGAVAMSAAFLRAFRLEGEGIVHGFGTRHLEEAAPELLEELKEGCARQVHGDRVLWVKDGVRPGAEEADALATDEARLVAVRTADCVPVLLADPRTGRVAAVHAGWRGTVARVVERAVESLVRAGSRQEDLLAAIGPAIRACCYEVSPKLAARFEAAFGPGVRQGQNLDLAIANRIS